MACWTVSSYDTNHPYVSSKDRNRYFLQLDDV
jgi:hypothetical protein